MTPYVLADFEPHLNSIFQVIWNADTIPLTLVLAAPLPQRAPPGLKIRAEPFQLQFEEPQWTLPQQTHRVVHAVLGELSIFMAPIGPNADGTGYRYQAAFT